MQAVGIHWLASWFVRARTSAADFLFPANCVACGRAGSIFCPECAQAVEPVGTEICRRCGRPQRSAIPLCANCQLEPYAPLSMTRIAALHTTPLREAIHTFKYENRPELAELLARYLVALQMQLDPLWKTWSVDGVVPVPLHDARLAERGYNQAELLADAFGRKVQLPVHPAWIRRQRLTQSQVGLSAQARQQNVEDAFVAHPAVRGQRLLLLDDVYTTGATMRACAAAALAAGATAVYGLALACPR